MKTLNLDIATEGIDFAARPDLKDKSGIEVCVDTIKNTFMSWGQKTQGMKEEDRRKYYKICDKFDEAIAKNVDKVELDDDWMGLIRKAFRDAPLLPSKLMRRVEEKIWEVKDR